MTERHSLTAFCVLVGAICYLATVAAVLAWAGRYAEALGFGGLTTGLVGVLGSFRPKASTIAVDHAAQVGPNTSTTEGEHP